MSDREKMGSSVLAQQSGCSDGCDSVTAVCKLTSRWCTDRDGLIDDAVDLREGVCAPDATTTSLQVVHRVAAVAPPVVLEDTTGQRDAIWLQLTPTEREAGSTGRESSGQGDQGSVDKSRC